MRVEGAEPVLRGLRRLRHTSQGVGPATVGGHGDRGCERVGVITRGTQVSTKIESNGFIRPITMYKVTGGGGRGAQVPTDG